MVYKRVFIEGKIPQITLIIGSQSSLQISGNLLQFTICGGLIQSLYILLR